MIDVPAALRAYAQRFEAALPQYLPAGDDAVCQAARYSVDNGGKRIRPALAMAVCELFGGQAGAVMPYAAALEMIHTYSLIHDDLPCMDNDDYRRGQLSCHRKFGEAAALLAGDALLTHAFLCAAEAQNSAEMNCKAAQILGRAAGTDGMIGGQQLDLLYEKTQKKISRRQLEEMNGKKTGALLSAACALGCLAAGADEAQTAAAAEYAAQLGLLFQITDDILDVTGNKDSLGKTTGKDEASGKCTWVTVLGLEKARAAAQQYAAAARGAIGGAKAGDNAPQQLLYALPAWLTEREY